MLSSILLSIAVFLGMKDEHIEVTTGETISLAYQLESVDKEWGVELWRTIEIGPDDLYGPWSLECYLSVCGRVNVLPASIYPGNFK